MEQTYFCPHCGHRSSEESSCPVCGAPMILASTSTCYCINCGTQASGNFCPNCGTPLHSGCHNTSYYADQTSTSAAPPPYGAPSCSKKKLPVWGIVLIIVAAVLMFFAALAITAAVTFGIMGPAFQEFQSEFSQEDFWNHNNPNQNQPIIPPSKNDSCDIQHPAKRFLLTGVRYGTGAELGINNDSSRYYVIVDFNLMNMTDQTVTLRPSNFYLQERNSNQIIAPTTELYSPDNTLTVPANGAIEGNLVFEISQQSSYTLEVVEDDGCLIFETPISK